MLDPRTSQGDTPVDDWLRAHAEQCSPRAAGVLCTLLDSQVVFRASDRITLSRIRDWESLAMPYLSFALDGSSQGPDERTHILS